MKVDSLQARELLQDVTTAGEAGQGVALTAPERQAPQVLETPVSGKGQSARQQVRLVSGVRAVKALSHVKSGRLVLTLHAYPCKPWWKGLGGGRIRWCDGPWCCTW